MSLEASIDAILQARMETSLCKHIPPAKLIQELDSASFHTAPYSGVYAVGTGDFEIEPLTT